jgi:hypothetical protein
VSLLVLAGMLALAHRWQKWERTPFSRGLRRSGRWFWAAGEGLEFGYHHARQVKQQISLDLRAPQ